MDASRASPFGTTEQSDPERVMAEMELCEGDLGDVVFEDPISEDTTRWMAVARVYTGQELSHYQFLKIM